MLENIRENSQGVIAKVILGFIILTFAVAGIGGYSSSVDTSVAEVNGEKISQQAFDQAYQAQRNRMAQQFGDMFDTLSADPSYMANFRNGVLDNLINEKLIDQSVRELAIRISDEDLKKTIREMPEFQVNGVFDNNRYLAIINQSGFFQSSDFRDYLRVELTRRQLSQALVATEFSLPYQTEQLTALQNQLRDVKFATISAEQFKAKVEVAEQEISDYYQNNQVMFENQEKVKVEYVALDVADIAKNVDVTSEEVNTFYRENINEFTKQEQRRVSHILVEAGEDEAAAKQQAEAILARIQAGEDFAELAKTESADTFSGENGGDLEWIERGVMDEAFDDAAFALAAAGDVSGVVQTSFGFHIIKLTELVAEQVQSFEEVEQELTARVKSDKAQNQFFELQQELARVAFEFPDSLDDAAGAVNAEVKTSDWLARNGNLAPFDAPSVIDAAFSDLVLSENLNSDVIEVNDGLVMVVRLAEHQPADVKPLSEVTAQITALLTNEKATAAAQTLVDDLVAKYNSGENIDAELSEAGSKFEEQVAMARFGAAVDSAIVRKAFTLPKPAENSIAAGTATLANGDLAIVQVTAVKAGNNAVNPQLAEQKANQLAQETYKGYVDSLKADAKISQRESIQETSAF
ncbi:SurA N-terminal domain-containing protein [Thalassotalea euphylliae]|uniref:Periplasmic chaperone PpiD n=1 Tax=Thalassotalea euphylliae TaxID=1655234 RepID=A0A3E0UHU2_9GAMM|nr:SurA N-terminal domain-containing protein [Thalassotalea euphylliae]REL36183.1 peptidylprolyl isomerase [Thalassotalea euphylliae]